MDGRVEGLDGKEGREAGRDAGLETGRLIDGLRPPPPRLIPPPPLPPPPPPRNPPRDKASLATNATLSTPTKRVNTVRFILVPIILLTSKVIKLAVAGWGKTQLLLSVDRFNAILFIRGRLSLPQYWEAVRRQLRVLQNGTYNCSHQSGS